MNSSKRPIIPKIGLGYYLVHEVIVSQMQNNCDTYWATIEPITIDIFSPSLIFMETCSWKKSPRNWVAPKNAQGHYRKTRKNCGRLAQLEREWKEEKQGLWKCLFRGSEPSLEKQGNDIAWRRWFSSISNSSFFVLYIWLDSEHTRKRLCTYNRNVQLSWYSEKT